jgi:uncharacterized membrane protein (UPF0182 family)
VPLADTSGRNTTSNQPRAASSSGKRIAPYYLYLKLPNETSEHFIVTVPFVPVSAGNSIIRLSSFLAASSDPGSYGKLQSFVMPQGETVLGPVQVDNLINSAAQISSAITLLNQQGSRVIRGSMQLIPVGNSIIYVRPFYVRGSGSSGYPKFQFLAVFTQDKDPVCAQTVNEALDQLFGRAALRTTCNVSSTGVAIPTPGTTTTPSTTTTPPGPSTTLAPSGTSTQDLLDQAAAKLDQAQQVLRTTGDLGQYQTLVNQAQALIQQARQQR